MSRNPHLPITDALKLLRALERELAGLDRPTEQIREGAEAIALLHNLLLGRSNGRHTETPNAVRGGGADIEQLLSEHLRFRQLFDFTTEAQFITSPEGVILDANQAASAMLHVPREFLLDKPLPLFVHEQCRFDFYTCLSKRRRGSALIREWRGRLHPYRGPMIEVMVWVAETNDEQYRPISLRWVMRDITALHSAELALMAERDFVKSLLDNAQAIFLVLENDRIVRVNPYLSWISGYEPDELLGQLWAVMLPTDEQEAARGMIEVALETGKSQRRSGSLVTRAGLRRAIDWSAKAFVRLDTRTNAVMVIGHDVTVLQEAQQQAVQAARLAALGQMMARLAHESRNLLQRCQSCLERLSWRVQGQPEALDLVSRAQATQRELTHLFEDVRAYAATPRLEVAPCELVAVWREAFEQVRTVAPNKEAVLLDDCDESTVCPVDRFRLLQVFRNLFSNSFDACAGRVEVTICCRGADLEGRPALELTIRDNGSGLNSEQRQRIFEPFYTTKPSGTGLGMAIVKRMVEAHGGRISLGKGPGAEFIITLPRAGT